MAGRAWARGELGAAADTAGDNAVADAAALGLDDSQLAQIRRALERDEWEGVWPDNVPAMEAFLIASTQWRTAAAGGAILYLGLDYAAADAGFRWAGFAMTPQAFTGLRLVEAGALAALNGQR